VRGTQTQRRRRRNPRTEKYRKQGRTTQGTNEHNRAENKKKINPEGRTTQKKTREEEDRHEGEGAIHNGPINTEDEDRKKNRGTNQTRTETKKRDHGE
jgi:hypothetical protein